MAKRSFQIVDEDTDFDPAVGAKKMPTNIAGTVKPRTDYFDAPVDKIVPCTLKGERDFSAVVGEKFQSIVDSVKEDGVIEALTLRYIGDGLWEALAGETRWRAAKAAGLETVPARRIDCDDEKARRIWAITNLARRDATIMDKIYGWWMYWESAKKRPGRKPQDAIIEDATDAQVQDSVAGISIRQIVKYHKIYSLEPGLLDLVAAGIIRIEPAYNLTFLTSEEQQYLIKIKARPSNTQSQALKKLSQDGEWSNAIVDQILNRTTTKSVKYVVPAKTVKKFKTIVSDKIAPKCYNKLTDIVAEAIDLYLEKHPEHSKQ